MTSINPEDFKATPETKLAAVPTRLDTNADEDEIEAGLNNVVQELARLQDTMYAHDRYSVLICFQGMDTSGKDSLIREVFSQLNPRGITVYSFKTPNDTELSHDYLWRHYLALPERGKFAIFNRTHYENVLVTRVHPEYILNEKLPGIEATDDIKPEFWEMRMQQIRNFEKHLAENGTIVLKFFMHLSKEEQRQRLLRRLEKQEHNWKFSVGDLRERERWDDYQWCYEQAISQTAAPKAPWYVIPADDKKMARYIVASIVWEEMKQYTDIAEPELDDEVKQHLREYEAALRKE